MDISIEVFDGSDMGEGGSLGSPSLNLLRALSALPTPQVIFSLTSRRSGLTFVLGSSEVTLIFPAFVRRGNSKCELP